MKERIRCLLLTFIIALVFCVNVSATEQTGAQLYYVTDEAGLLSENENMMLEKMAETVSQKYGIGVYIVTVEDYRDFHSATAHAASMRSTAMVSRNWKRYSLITSVKMTGTAALRITSKNAASIWKKQPQESRFERVCFFRSLS